MVETDIVDRLETTTKRFGKAVIYGSESLPNTLTERCGVQAVVLADDTPARLPRFETRLVFDEELSPIAPSSVDLIISVLSLHAVNDLIGALIQARTALKPDGLFIGALLGGETLKQQKIAVHGSEIDATGRSSVRFSPLAHIKDLGAALQRAGFALPVADVDRYEVTYSSARKMISDLREMAETGYMEDRPPPLSKMTAAAILNSLPTDAVFEVITLTGWAPSANQQKPLAPGSGKVSLHDAILKSDRKT
ncbi:MAG: methyltransferase domain-containing protein [Pseudomonadota bacterium]